MNAHNQNFGQGKPELAVYRHALDRLGVADHGVHPDAPKNVSKSITVD